RSLAGASGARHLRRVSGWPIGAIAVRDTIYVNAAWLVALAPPSGGGPDAGADATVPAPTGTLAATTTATGAVPDTPPPAGRTGATDEVRTSALTYADGGTEVMPAQDPAPSPDDQACSNFAVGCADTCATSDTTDEGDTCSDTSDDGNDSCDSSSDDSGQDACASGADDGTDACASSSDDSGQACASAGDDASAGCQVGAGSRRPRRGRGVGSHGCLLLPLGYLLLIRRRR
ncbi:MAG TPA: hypothetical protein VNO55_32085, partial [Polyangia bacterium]|nr:hypothetical protein [Polyangia bacterium]